MMRAARSGWRLARLWIGAEWRAHPGRSLLAVLAVALGVALGLAVQLVNRAALSEFTQAVRSASGEADLLLRPASGWLDERFYPRVAAHAAVAVASPLLEFDALAWPAPQRQGAAGMPERVTVLARDAWLAAQLGASVPEWQAGTAGGDGAPLRFDPDALWLSAPLAARLGVARGSRLALARGASRHDFTVAGVAEGETRALVYLDIASAQWRLGLLGRLSGIDLRLAPGARWDERLAAELALPADWLAAAPAQSQQRLSNVSRAYRVNLTVLALVALVTGAFLVHAVQMLAVVRRVPQLALLGTLGASGAQRRALVLAEAALLGMAGALLGLLLGVALAAAALRLVGGDLGGGYFAGVQPRLALEPWLLALYALLGLAAALAGGWLPARQAERLQPAQALKSGLPAPTTGGSAARAAAWPLALLAAAGLLALLPPLGGLALAAYAAVALVLLAAVTAVPAALQLLAAAGGARGARRALPMLAHARLVHQRREAAAAAAAVVASLALAVAMTVMVASFRSSVDRWLQQVLPAELYLRAPPGSGRLFDDATLARLHALPGVARLQASRSFPLAFAPDQAPVTVLLRRIDLRRAPQLLPLAGPYAAPPTGALPVALSETAAARLGTRAGGRLLLRLGPQPAEAFVAAVYRDYARQQGTVLLDRDVYLRAGGLPELADGASELALWFDPGSDAAALQQSLRTLLGEPLDMATPGELRAISLRIFDRSFAVTVWLQALAVGIGLAGIGASLALQLLARRREFGLLAHLGLTSGELRLLVVAETLGLGLLALLLGLAGGALVAVLLVQVVNPQSFHWTMELHWPWPRLAALAAAVLAACLAVAALAARGLGGRAALAAVRDEV
jgi:putative ABC transport system permease protein